MEVVFGLRRHDKEILNGLVTILENFRESMKARMKRFILLGFPYSTSQMASALSFIRMIRDTKSRELRSMKMASSGQ